MTGRSSYKSVASNGLAHFVVMDLTKDHHPDRDDERSRVENAGGYVLDWGGVARVNGQLAVSRAIGDVSFKRSATFHAGSYFILIYFVVFHIDLCLNSFIFRIR